MITSKQIIKLLEEYADSGTKNGHYIEVYKNPSSSDFLAMAKTAKKEKRTFDEIRFIGDTQAQILYVADAYSTIHPEIPFIVNLPMTNLKYWFLGNAKVVTGKATATLVEPMGKAFGKKDCKFADAYIPNCSSMIKIR